MSACSSARPSKYTSLAGLRGAHVAASIQVHILVLDAAPQPFDEDVEASSRLRRMVTLSFTNDGAGCVRSVPANWTNLVADDPFNVVAAGWAAFRTQELLELLAIAVRMPACPARPPHIDPYVPDSGDGSYLGHLTGWLVNVTRLVRVDCRPSSQDVYIRRCRASPDLVSVLACPGFPGVTAKSLRKMIFVVSQKCSASSRVAVTTSRPIAASIRR